jgi:lipopolysaccharide transport system ATP-binding protein
MNSFIHLRDISVTYPFRDPAYDSLRGKFVRILKKNVDSVHDAELDVKALKSVNLDISEGERVGLIGSNGSGKSTLLKVLAGVLYPTEGEMLLKGSVNSIFDPALGMDPEASGLENIRIRCMLMRVPVERLDDKCTEIAAFSELGAALRRPIKTYSAGMSVRLAFSIATAVEPEILVMDEWLSAGDARFVSKALKRMEVLVRASRMLVLASHSEDILTNWCTRLIWFENGELLEDGLPNQILRNYRKYSKAE